MKPIGAKVRWNERYATGAELEIAVDEIPNRDDLIYDLKEVGGYTLAFAEKDGYVSFFAHDPRNESGYGGDIFKVRTREFTKDGIEVLQTKSFRGPWSSRSGSMNHYFTQSLDIHLTDKLEVLDKGYTFWAGHVTLEFAKLAVEQFLEDVAIIEIKKFGAEDISYEIVSTIPPEFECQHGGTQFAYRCGNCKQMNYGIEGVDFKYV